MTPALIEYLKLILADREIELPEENIESAAATHNKLHDEFRKLYAQDLRFLPPYIEPATALRWIESYQDSGESM